MPPPARPNVPAPYPAPFADEAARRVALGELVAELGHAAVSIDQAARFAASFDSARKVSVKSASP